MLCKKNDSAILIWYIDTSGVSITNIISLLYEVLNIDTIIFPCVEDIDLIETLIGNGFRLDSYLDVDIDEDMIELPTLVYSINVSYA